jgi:poly(hydroxyalkanoate) granule-associated protein
VNALLARRSLRIDPLEGAGMAKFKKKAGRKSTGDSASAQAQAEQLSKRLSESAQQVWLAGVGAFGRAQAEGTKLFEALVKEGMGFEQSARKFAGGRADTVRDAVEARVGQARERATDTWDRLEKVFEDRVQRALVKLGVPNREDLADLSRRVDTLTAELRRQEGAAPARKAAARKTVARKAAAKRASTKKASNRAPKPPTPQG